MIDISNLNKAAVVAALFNASKQQGLGFLDPTGATPMTEEAAQELITSSENRIRELNRRYEQPEDKGLAQALDFDYLRGRVMKVALHEDTFEEYLYDRDNGPGAAERAIQHLRSTGKVFSRMLTVLVVGLGLALSACSSSSHLAHNDRRLELSTLDAAAHSARELGLDSTGRDLRVRRSEPYPSRIR